MSIGGPILFMWSLITLSLYIIMAVVLQNNINNIYKARLSSSIINQVVSDWQTPPFVDVLVVETNSTHAACPAEYPEVVMQRMFYGLHVACDCTGIKHRSVHG